MEQTPYEKLFDENCIIDISRIKSNETKALIMGLMVYILDEYRVDQKTENNSGLKHVTVLEEAHNLLKNTSDGSNSQLVGKSVEMLTQTIAEIRTYGEGFIIVDQSPSSVDISAIKNTNTKIVLRTPEANDREAVGRSMGLTEDQVNEIAKLPSGVAVVYQNDWVSPVLALIKKADVEETAYLPKIPVRIKTKTSARTAIIKMLMQPWMPGPAINDKVLNDSLKVIDVPRNTRNKIITLMSDYRTFDGHLIWKKEQIGSLQKIVKDVLGINDIEIASCRTPDELIKKVSDKVKGMNKNDINEICHLITMKGEGE